MKDSVTQNKDDGGDDLLSLENYPNKTDRVYQILLNNITKRNFSPGDKLGEQSLADKLGISKTPVREALSRLERENLVEIYPNRGAFVVEIGKEDIIEIYDLREVLDGLAARKAAERMGKPGLQRIENLIGSMEEAVNEEDLESYASHDSEFHRLLEEFSENKRLKKMVQNLRYQSRILMSSSVKIPGRAKESCQEHTKIFYALEERDGAKAERLIRRHTENTKEVVFEHLGGKGHE